MRRLLFVCIGNLCRSPMAVGLMRTLLSLQGHEDEVEVQSAGTWAAEGLPASPLAIEVMAERGIDISGHLSHGIEPQDVEEAHLVVVMSQGLKDTLEAEFPAHQEKVILLSALAGEAYDINDPYGSDSIELYRRCAEEIEGLLRNGYDGLMQLLERKQQGSRGTG